MMPVAQDVRLNGIGKTPETWSAMREELLKWNRYHFEWMDKGLRVRYDDFSRKKDEIVLSTLRAKSKPEDASEFLNEL